MIDQSMTLDHLQLIKRLHAFRRLHVAYANWKIVYVNFDVSGWCGNFRKMTVDHVMEQTLDQVFATNLFSKTHKAYENTLFYMPGADGVWSWEGLGGGVEGLNQFTWMLVYLAQMRYALDKFGFRAVVMAYGDDYKAALLIPPNRTDLDIEQFRSEVVQGVTKTMKEHFGQKMKAEDSYGSEKYTSFCKNAAVGVTEMPQGVLRKSQKSHGTSNAFLPTLDEYVSCAFSNAHSAARYMTCYYPAYRVALFWLFRQLTLHPQYAVLSDSSLVAHSLIPSCIGGLPIIYLHNFAVRTESDHLTVFLDLVKYTEESSHSV